MTIGVPYGTSYWQVGDSAEQNGCFKMGTYKAKEALLRHHEDGMLGHLGIQPSDIITVVNEAWKGSFARVETNKKAIAERGWFPYNRNVLLHKDILATMTENEMNDDMLGMDIIIDSQKPASSVSPSGPEQYDQFISRTATAKPVHLNLGHGMGLHVLKTIVAETDLCHW